MTDITEQDTARLALAWAEDRAGKKLAPETGQRERDAAVRFILATVDAPEPTLAEEVKKGLLFRVNDTDAEGIKDALDLAARVEQIEQERDHFFREVEDVRNWKERLINERDEARAEVERLTTVNENLRKTDNYRQFREQFLTVQKGAESNAETTDPADVKPGEAWVVECHGERRTAVKDNGIDIPWNTINADGWYLSEDNEDVTPITRMVPAPRVITNPDELDRLAEGSIVRDRAGHAWERYPDEDWYSTEELDPEDVPLPATVLYTPEETK